MYKKGLKNYLLSLIFLQKSKMNLDTLEPLDELADSCKKYMQNVLRSKASTVSEICADKSDPIYSELEKGKIRLLTPHKLLSLVY